MMNNDPPLCIRPQRRFPRYFEPATLVISAHPTETPEASVWISLHSDFELCHRTFRRTSSRQTLARRKTSRRTTSSTRAGHATQTALKARFPCINSSRRRKRGGLQRFKSSPEVLGHISSAPETPIQKPGSWATIARPSTPSVQTTFNRCIHRSSVRGGPRMDSIKLRRRCRAPARRGSCSSTVKTP